MQIGNNGGTSTLSINRSTLTGYIIGAGTNSSNGNGAILSTTGSWTNGSSVTLKERFSDIDDVLDRIAKIPVREWNYRPSDEAEFDDMAGTHADHVKQVRAERHVGPVAEDFYAQFPRVMGDENRNLAPADVAGVALGGVKALIERIEQLENRLAELGG